MFLVNELERSRIDNFNFMKGKLSIKESIVLSGDYVIL